MLKSVAFYKVSIDIEKISEYKGIEIVCLQNACRRLFSCTSE